MKKIYNKFIFKTVLKWIFIFFKNNNNKYIFLFFLIIFILLFW